MEPFSQGGRHLGIPCFSAFSPSTQSANYGHAHPAFQVPHSGHSNFSARIWPQLPTIDSSHQQIGIIPVANVSQSAHPLSAHDAA